MDSQLSCDHKELVCIWSFNLTAFQLNEVDATIYRLPHNSHMAKKKPGLRKASKNSFNIAKKVLEIGNDWRYQNCLFS